jgi:MFS family permease
MGGSPPTRVVLLMCLAEALSMTGFAAYPAFLARLRDLWGISNSQAGFIGGAFFTGYMAAVPLLSGLTDRVDARRVHAASCAAAGLSLIGFAAAARGAATAACFQALAGAALAGSYMPGLKALTDRVTGPRQNRFIAFYTSTFGIGTSLSLLLAGWLGSVLPWPWAFGMLAAGPFCAGLLVTVGLQPQPQRREEEAPRRLLRFREVLGDRTVLGYIVGYAVHCWELLGLRSWMVAFILFAYSLTPGAAPLVSATGAAALINLLGIPASILGNEAATRAGRGRYVAFVMAASGCLAWTAGFAAGLPWWVMLTVLALYFVMVMADSAALTAGLVAATPPQQRGAAMAIYSFLGFGAGFLAPLVFGGLLDLGGGAASPFAWGLAFGSLGIGCLTAALAKHLRVGSRAR